MSILSKLIPAAAGCGGLHNVIRAVQNIGRINENERIDPQEKISQIFGEIIYRSGAAILFAFVALSFTNTIGIDLRVLSIVSLIGFFAMSYHLLYYLQSICQRIEWI